MTSSTATLRQFTDAAADTIARALATFRREAQRDRELYDAERRAHLAEVVALKASVGELERKVADRLASLKDGDPGKSITVADVAPLIMSEVHAAVSALPPPANGKDADPVVIERLVAAAVAALPPAEPGKNADPEETAALVRVEVAKAVAAIPPPKDGDSVTLEDARPVIVTAVDNWLRDNPPAPGEPGKNADPALIASAVAEAVAALPKAQDGKNLEPEDAREIVAQEVERFLTTNPPLRGEKGDCATADQVSVAVISYLAAHPVQNGKNADPVTTEELASVVANYLSANPPPKGEKGDQGPPGKFPATRAWVDAVHYEGAVVSHGGSIYQANRDTGREPPHGDWTCIVDAGRDGRSFKIRGTHSGTGKYRELDIVALNGASFVARRDDPGPCPGDGWQLWASQGKQGKPGQPGAKGDPGPRGLPGPAIVDINVDDEGLLTLKNADGSVVTGDLYPLLSKLK